MFIILAVAVGAGGVYWYLHSRTQLCQVEVVYDTEGRRFWQPLAWETSYMQLHTPVLTPTIRISLEGSQPRTFPAAMQTARDLPGRFEFSANRKTIDSEGVPATAEVLEPCGWRPAHVSASWVTPRPPVAKLDIVIRIGREKQSRISTIYIDNRGGGQTQLAVGEMAISIPAGGKYAVEIQEPDCAGGAKVTVAGEPAGVILPRSDLPAADKDSVAARDFLLDVTGNRCYRMRSIQYGTSEFGPVPESRYSRRKLHALEPISFDYFLSEAPKTIRAEGPTSRYELNEISCVH